MDMMEQGLELVEDAKNSSGFCGAKRELMKGGG